MDEFFSARTSNPETRRAYARAVGWFLEFCEREDVELHRVTAGLVSLSQARRLFKNVKRLQAFSLAPG